MTIKNILQNLKKLSLRKTQALRKEQIGKVASEIARLDFVRHYFWQGSLTNNLIEYNTILFFFVVSSSHFIAF